MRTSRRGFLKTLGGVALFSIVPRHVLGNGYIAPSDQLTKGIIGYRRDGKRPCQLCRYTFGCRL